MRHRVLLLKSKNIFANLALEDVIYQTAVLNDCNYLLIWRSDPCLVLGRHQNPWDEFNVAAAQRAGVAISRRNSGGGAVYHDLGNLNLSFMTGRDQYDRRENLHFLSRVLKRWRISVSLSSRDDLLLNGQYKVSGTASKLGRKNAYHHCTLLYNANLESIRDLLKPSFEQIQSKATKSVPSPVANVGISNFDGLIDSIVEEYTKWKTGEPVEIFKLSPEKDIFDDVFDRKSYLSTFRMLTSWDWIFGRTPPFTIIQSLPHCDHSFSIDITRGQLQCHVTAPEDQRLSLLSEACDELSDLHARSSVLVSALEHCRSRWSLAGRTLLGSDKLYFDCLMRTCEQFGN